MVSKYGKIFNIRVPPQKQAIIDEFKELVIKDLHSDICYVTTMLLESFVKANRPLKDPTIIKLVKHEITINQNCTNIYGAGLKRARRVIPTDHLRPTELPKCEACGLPATRRYLFPYHGFMDLCVEHRSHARRSLGYRDLAGFEPAIIPELTPTFPLKPQPKRRKKRHPSISTRKKRKKKRSFFARVWSRVKQLLTKLVLRLFWRV